MCGIIGYSGEESAKEKLILGLKALEYRGYDSSGIALFEDDIVCIKSVGRISKLEEKINSQNGNFKATCGIGHTRWATHGVPSDENSHPHGTKNLLVVHNGIIENYNEIKTFLTDKGYTFYSQTDTEIASKLFDYYYLLEKEPLDAIIKTQKLLKGSYAILLIFKERKNEIYCIRKDSPLILAKSKSGNFVASDMGAILKYTNKYYTIDEGEVAKVSKDGILFFDKEKNEIKKEEKTAKMSGESVKKDGYPHFMLKEINQEPKVFLDTVKRYYKNGFPEFDIPDLNLEKIKKIHIVACGTAMHSGLIGKFLFESLAGVCVNVEVASEFRYNASILSKDDLVIAISQSGETADTIGALRKAKEKGIFTLAVVNVLESTLSREADGVIYTLAGPEIAVASTKAYIVQLAIMYAFSINLAYKKGLIEKEKLSEFMNELLSVVPEKIKEALKMENECKTIAKKYKDSSDIFFIGRGIDYVSCMEASLKLKEISYIHSEAYPAGELKHGTISLITEKTPVFAIITKTQTFEKMINNIKEVKSRGAKVILLCTEDLKIPKDTADDILYLPKTDELFMSIPTTIISQLISYHFALCLGNDVDKPRNLAKSVTVE